MKQKFSVCLALLFLLMLCLAGTALAEIVPEVSVVLSENRFNGPAEVQVTITVTNAADTDMPGPCALYDPNGALIRDFGQPTLAAGASHTWTGTWMVTEEQLLAGRVAYVIAYTVPDGEGVLVPKTRPVAVTIVNAGAEARLEMQRTITPATARQNQKVYVIYTITNTGNAEATDVTLKESSAISSATAKLGSLKPGETVTHMYTVTMGKKDLASKATVTWKANGESGSASVDEATIRYADVKLTATVAADKKGGLPGEVVKLTLTLKNTGKSDIGNITVTDPVLGTVFSGLTVEAGKTATFEREVTVTSTADHIFTVSGTNASGAAIETATDFVQIIAVDPAKAVTLSVAAEANTTTIYTKPGIVKFTVHVTNTGSVPAENVTVSASGVKVYPYNDTKATIAPGETLTFSRDVRVDTPGNFRFDAATAGQLGETLTFQSNLVLISYAPPTATPRPNPISTPAVPVTEPVPQSAELAGYYDALSQGLDIAFPVLLGLSALCAVLIAVGVIGRSNRSAKSRQAADTLERTAVSDYTQPVPSRRRRYIPESEATEEAPENDDHPYMAEEPEDLPSPEEAAAAEEEPAPMEEVMNELYPEVAQQEEGTYRRRRRTTQDE